MSFVAFHLDSILDSIITNPKRVLVNDYSQERWYLQSRLIPTISESKTSFIDSQFHNYFDNVKFVWFYHVFSCVRSIDRNIKSETSIVYNYHLFCSTVTYFTLSHEFNWVRRPKPFTAGWHQLANLLKKNLKRPPLLTSGRSCCIGNIKCEIRPYLWWPRLLYPAMLFMMTFWEM